MVFCLMIYKTIQTTLYSMLMLTMDNIQTRVNLQLDMSLYLLWMY